MCHGVAVRGLVLVRAREPRAAQFMQVESSLQRNARSRAAIAEASDAPRQRLASACDVNGAEERQQTRQTIADLGALELVPFYQHEQRFVRAL